MNADPDPGGKNLKITEKSKDLKKVNVGQLNVFFTIFFFFNYSKLFILLFCLKFFKLDLDPKIRIPIEKAAGSGSALRKTAGPGSVKNECGYSAL